MITLDMLIEDLVEQHPQVVPVLVRNRVVCIQCGEPVWGMLGEALKRAKITDPEGIIKEMQAAVK